MDNHMYGGLADTEFPGSAPDGRLVLYDVKSQMTGTLLNIPLQDNTLHSALLSQLYERGRGVMMERTAAHNVSRRGGRNILIFDVPFAVEEMICQTVREFLHFAFHEYRLGYKIIKSDGFKHNHVLPNRL